ncbi:MAG: hypothetical protein KAV83_13570 [Desulfobacterales bacterium]|nr:hypothetical protein [Desulfobacterales bacterium]
MNLKLFKLLIVIIILGLCCLIPSRADANTQGLFISAADDAVTQAVQSLDSWCKEGRCEKVGKKVAVWEVDNDQNLVLWNRVQTGIVKTGLFEVYTLADTEDAKKILEEHGRQLKYEDRYDRDTLVDLGKLIAPKAVIVGKVESIQIDKAGCTLTLLNKLLDLKTGQVVWAEILSGKSKVEFSTVTWTWRGLICVAVLGLSIFFVFWANWQSLRFAHFWILLAGVVGMVFWFLVGRYL